MRHWTDYVSVHVKTGIPDLLHTENAYHAYGDSQYGNNKKTHNQLRSYFHVFHLFKLLYLPIIKMISENPPRVLKVYYYILYYFFINIKPQRRKILKSVFGKDAKFMRMLDKISKIIQSYQTEVFRVQSWRFHSEQSKSRIERLY